ncbi:MAG: helix-turn-helix domain-containing protein [Planctomycetia bacterium]|nr:helix-turn-helix domain-containing protein [Planctomycetia bacterium]
MDDLDHLRLLTYKQAAKPLGVTERTIYAYVDAGELPVVKLGRLRRIRPEDLVVFIGKRREFQNGR